MMESTGKSARRSGRHILIIVENLPVPFDTRVWQQARALRSNGYEVSVICPQTAGYRDRREILEGVHIYRHPMPVEARRAREYLVEYPLALFWQLILAFRIFFRRRFAVIHACNPPDTIFLVAAIFKLFFGVRFVFDHHDLCPELYDAKFAQRKLAYRILLTLERLTFRLADMSIAPNDSYRKIGIERGGMAPDDVVVVRSGPDMNRLRIMPPDLSLKRGKRYLVGYIGVMGHQEGIGYLIDAARHIVHRVGRHDIHFGLVGGGSELERLKERVRTLGLEDYFTFTGRASDAVLLAMTNAADLCVNTDEWNAMNDKSTMNKVMEYMALAKPIVQFDLTEGRVSAADASLYARPNDPIDLVQKILELLDDPERRRLMGACGRRRVEMSLAWDHQVPKLLAVYERLWQRTGVVRRGSRLSRLVR
jgi:glycosyltransferase involved in cell wall biosynthesis